MSIRQPVGQAERAYHDEDVESYIPRVARLPCFHPSSVHLSPPPQRFHGTRGQKQPEEDHGSVEDHTLRIQNALSKRLEMRNEGEGGDNRGPSGCFIGTSPNGQPKDKA